MAVSKNKVRITITCSEEQVVKLDAYADKMGMNRSALCAYFIGQGLIGMDKSFGIVDKFADRLSEEMLKGMSDKALDVESV